MEELSEEEQGRNRRRFFRLQFPKGEELVALIMGVEYLVTEISERSLRFTVAEIPCQWGLCEGVLHWHDGRMTPFQGRNGPVRQSERIIIEVDGIAFADIIREQRRLLAKYPMLKVETE